MKTEKEKFNKFLFWFVIILATLIALLSLLTCDSTKTMDDYTPPREPFAYMKAEKLNNNTVKITLQVDYFEYTKTEIYPMHKKKPKMTIFNRDEVVYNYDESGMYSIFGKVFIKDHGWINASIVKVNIDK